MMQTPVTPVLDVHITINDMIQGAQGAAVVLLTIGFEKRVPTYRARVGERESVGYMWVKHYQHDYDWYSLPETEERRITPIRSVFKVSDGTYRMLLRPNDDLEACIGSLADVLVESQGHSVIDYAYIVEQSPIVRIAYASPELESRLKVL